MQIPLGIGAYSRPFGRLPEIRLENRFFEQNPVGAEKVALLSRPGTRLFLEVGDGPIRALHSQKGVHNGDLFVVSGDTLFRYDGENITEIEGTVQGDGYPPMASVAVPGWDALFISDGNSLQYYEGEGHSTGILEADPGGVVTTDGVRIGDVYYAWTDGDVDGAAADGTSGSPWLVALGADDAAALKNMFDAINLSGTPGLTYSTATVPHPDVRAISLTEASFRVRAIIAGEDGDTIVTTTTSSALQWGAGTLEDGGGNELKESSIPAETVVVDLATLASFVLLVEGGSRRFFWLRPGEVDVDPLDFASMESEPDPIVNIVTSGDQFWLFGESSSEVWYATGDANDPFQRAQGRAFSQGIIPNTVARHQDVILVVGQDMVAYRIAGAPERISHHGIEEKLRRWQTG